MILAAGLSPAWQQTVVLDRLETGAVNRATEVRWCASGKVLNVGLALHALSSSPFLGTAPRGTLDCRTLALVGGTTGAAIRREFAERKVAARWIDAAHPTRVCTTILDRTTGRTTELVENAGTISSVELDAFRLAFREEAKLAQIVVLTGSLPAGAPPTLYCDLMRHVAGRVILDCQGEPLLAALAARPFVVKPNREELGRTLGRAIDTDNDLHSAMREMNARGAEWVVVTHGKHRVWISSANSLHAIDPPSVELVNPIGSGDCLAAGIAIGIAAGHALPDAAALGVAVAAENVRHLLPAQIDPVAVAGLLTTLRVAVFTVQRRETPHAER